MILLRYSTFFVYQKFSFKRGGSNFTLKSSKDSQSNPSEFFLCFQYDRIIHCNLTNGLVLKWAFRNQGVLSIWYTVHTKYVVDSGSTHMEGLFAIYWGSIRSLNKGLNKGSIRYIHRCLAGHV